MTMVKGTKWDAAEAMLKLILKDPDRFCYNCGDKYNPSLFPCCHDPLIDTWAGHLRILLNEIKEANKVNLNRYGSNKEKTLRSCVTLPPALLTIWSRMFQKQYGEPLLRTYDKRLYKIDVRNMMRRLPMFRRCETI